MFQTYDDIASPDTGPARLAALRAQMAERGLDGFLVPRADAHQGEYVAPHDDRLAWLTGFTGSAGICAALMDKAGVFVDGRYRVQVRAQVADVFTPVAWPEVEVAEWLNSEAPKGAKIGIDPWLHRLAEVRMLEETLTGAELVRCANLVDAVWDDQPAPPMGTVFEQPVSLAGETREDKIARLAAGLGKAACAIITLPDSIAWLLNIRGSDIPRNPVPHGFAVLHADARVTLFIAPGKTEGLDLGACVTERPVDAFLEALAELDGPVMVDPASVPLIVVDRLQEAGRQVVEGQDPCLLPKARKNAVEIEGSRQAHLRDAAAMARFLCWLDAQPPGTLTEIDVAMALEAERRNTNALRDISFETISGAGAHGAIVHYRVTNSTNAPVLEGQLLLVDSGGQYVDGTTDITRTMAIGTPGEEERQNFTRVLQGMIAISRLRFPKGLAGRDIDALARARLWEAGLDYAHGTGHGVGAYLSVHEGPQRLARSGTVPFEPGMILSNEPGFYREGAYGIRIENLIVVQKALDLPGQTVQDMLCFETLTWVPIDRRLIDVTMLTNAERDWLNAYHQEVESRVLPLLDGPAAEWLVSACQPL
ncbi:aminopeptidase P family protein [Pseudoprimorskyibacter insulae]|uniref:Putative dipeptidase PepE n=1 Tax=Pseudoprimorskyibacter insulae TaxID=1695997 RepID=A0A2R8AX85_9RHOB|nr:aminopeptidase P family protein [Pseudoprimorskyibacter insulae]SPF80608.1 putative dipeptidase PepE [Pseudoprimorskyibacter insulae]